MLVTLKASDAPHVRLVAFPHAGGSASAYRGTLDGLPAEVDICAVQYPGRGSRHKEPVCTDLDELCESVIAALKPTLNVGLPFSFFGHSFGSLVAVEVATRLSTRGLQPPIALLLSSHPAPGVELDEMQATLSQITDDGALLEALRLFDFSPDALASGDDDGASARELLALTVPAIRADLELREAWCAAALGRARAGSPAHAVLPAPVHVFGGRAERSFPPAALDAWRAFAPPNAQTGAPAFSCTMIEGGHFYLDAPDGQAALLPRVASEIAAALALHPRSVVAGVPPPPPERLTYVHEMIEACAAATPDALALVDRSSRRTYAQLVDEATCLAGWLVDAGARPGKSIALLLAHAAEFVIAQLATHLSGASCFGLEGHFGPTMMHELLADTPPTAALAAPKFAERLAAALPPADGHNAPPTLTLDSAGAWLPAARAAAARVPERAVWARAAPYDTGIVTMTSGTTGRPKAIACPTVSYAVAVRARQHSLPYSPSSSSPSDGDAAAAVCDVEACNVMFVWEALRPLCYGHACLVVPDDVILDTTRLAAYLGEHGATRVLSTPSLLATLIETAAEATKFAAPLADKAAAPLAAPLALTLCALRVWLLCGEVVPAALPAKVAASLPAVALVNDYSSWEGSDVTLALLPPTPPAPTSSGTAVVPPTSAAPVGAPLQGVCCAVLHPKTGEPVPVGGVGELYVSSPMLFTAYLGARTLTADRLRPMPPAMRRACAIDADPAALAYARMHAAATRRIDAAAAATEAAAPSAAPAVDVSDAAEAEAGTGSSPAADEWSPLAYRTGDLCRLLPSGALQILGRADSTIKIRGFKVGLPYVEGVIGSIAGVGHVAVVPLLEEGTGNALALVAHLLPDAASAAAAVTDERDWLNGVRDAARKELAAHSLPAHWMLTPQLANLSDGESKKLDRKRLPKPDLKRTTVAISAVATPRAGGAAGAPPQLGGPASPAAAMEAAMAPIWAEVLETDVGSFDCEDSFFDIGGHSLLASKLVATLSSRLATQLRGRSVTVLDLFDAPSLSLLAAALAPAAPESSAVGGPRPLLSRAGARVDLAIIGAAGRFPGAGSVNALWGMLKAGKDALRLWSAAELAAKGVSADVWRHPDFVPGAYLIDGAQHFDAGFWGIAPHEAKLTDPQHRVFLQVAWQAFENAGYAPRTGTPARTAVFASSGIDGYMVHHLEGKPLKDSLNPGDIFLGEIGSEKDYITTRVSYALDLMGPSLAVNSACSSALSAVTLAANSLAASQSDMALAGGSALTFPGTGYLFEEGLVNSIDGKVRPFDAKAHGTVFGDAVGAVVLRRLSDALAADDNVLCVWRGCGVSNDGARKVGYAAPGVAGQAQAVRDALYAAGVSSDQVSYVECHATGTLVGDGIELRALTEAFASMVRAHAPTPSGQCAIGSIKGNIGHANAAAGVTGLIKAAMCLHTRTLVPTAHFETLNAKVDLANGPFHVHEGAATAWSAPAHGGPRIAGVSSFGIGGANVHCVLEEPPALPPAADGAVAGSNDDGTHAPVPCKRDAHVLTLSAKSASALARMASELADWLGARAADGTAAAAPSLGRVAITLHLGREAFVHRATVVATSRETAIAGLRNAAEGAADDAAANSVGRGRKVPTVLLIFPGQGSQCPRMGEGLYRVEPIFRKHVDRLCAQLEPLLGFDLRRKLYPNALGDDLKDSAYLAEFNAPKVTQPAIFVTELALGYMLVELGVTPAGLAGHSIGEIVAATLAGVFDEADALRLIATRARLSADNAPEGRMLAVNCDEATAAAAAAEQPDKVWTAVLNARGRQVLAGEPAAVDAAAAALGAKGIKSRPLPVNRAYHTPLMAKTQRALAELLATMLLRAPSVPLCCNGTGGWMAEEKATDPQYWAAHVASAVRWADNMDALAKKAPALVVEVGSGSSLGPLLAECGASGADELRALPTLRHPRVDFSNGLADQEAFGETLGQLWEGGVPLAWSAYHRDERYIKLSLPTYSFEPDVHWINDDASMYVAPTADALAAAQETIDAESAIRKAADAAAALVEPSLVRLRTAASAERKWVSAYCLAYAGGSTAAFSELARAAPEWVEVVGIEMPGKGELADAKWPADVIEQDGVGMEGKEGGADNRTTYTGTSSSAGSSADPLSSAEGSPRSSRGSSRASVGEVAAALAVTAAQEKAMMEKLAERIAADAIGSSLVLVGWSMGGMLAAELALMLTARGCPPQMLHVAGRMAPGSFIAAGEDVDKYLLASDEMKATDAWKEWLLPMLMADLRADARAEQRVAAAWSDALATRADGTPPLSCTLQVCAGSDDAAFPPDAVAAWRPLSTGRFETHVLAGGHDILQRCTIELLRHISRALLPSTPLYQVEWRALPPPDGAKPTPPLSPGLAWHKLTGVVADATTDTAANSSSVASAAGAEMEARLARFETALQSPAGLVLDVPADEEVASQEGVCWEFIHLVQQLVGKGASGRLVLVCPAKATCSALVSGASKAVPLEFPELSVQRVHVPPAVDLLHSPGPFGAIAQIATAYLGWLARLAADNPLETDLWVDPKAPDAPRVQRLAPRRALPPSGTPAVDPNGTYLVTGGTGGVGGALIAWLLYEQHVPPHHIVLLSRRDVASPHVGVRCIKADLSSAHALGRSAELCALPNVTGIFHLAGVLDDGLLMNMTKERLQKAVAPKAGVLSLLELCVMQRWSPRWLVAASSTSSLLGYAGQSNYCAANGLLDHLATFGLPSRLLQQQPQSQAAAAADRPATPTAPQMLTLNFGPWGEVGMAREGTKAHQLSLQSGELPMASSAAISCIAEALRQLRAATTHETAHTELGGFSAPRARGEPLGGANLQFAVADVEWWRSPWPSHPLLQGVMHRLLPAPPDGSHEAEAEAPSATGRANKIASGSDGAPADAAVGPASGDGQGGARVVEWLKGRLSNWQPVLPLVELGLDSLDLVQLRNGFQKKFKVTVPMATFTNAQQTLEELIGKLAATA